MFVGKLGTFVALGVRGSRMIENRSFNLVKFYVKMDKSPYDKAILIPVDLMIKILFKYKL